MPRYAKKTDSNHAEIRDALRKAGVEVYDTSGVGGGFPDLAAKHCQTGRTVLLEVKSKGGKLTKLQKALAEYVEYRVVRTIWEAYEAVDVPWHKRAWPVGGE